MAMARVIFTAAPFEAQYDTASAPPTNPQPEPVLMITPPPAFSITGMAYLLIKKIDLTLTAITRSHSSSVVSNTVARRIIPALLNRMSSPSNSSTVSRTARRQSAAWLTSQRIKMACPPSSLIVWTTLSPPTSSRSAMATAAPSRANRVAVARPIPDAPPVISARFPAKFPMTLLPPRQYPIKYSNKAGSENPSLTNLSLIIV